MTRSKSGTLLDSPETLKRVIEQYAQNGWQVNTHVIGDLANRVVLDAYQQVNSPHQRHRIEHAQIVALEDIARFGQLGVIPSMQPTHATSDMGWAQSRIGSSRILGAYAWKSMLDVGVPALPLSSDFPVEQVNPLLGFYSAISRLDLNGNSPHGSGGWFANQRLSRQEALRGFTLDAAYASFDEHRTGSIITGKLADFALLDTDIMKVPYNYILRARVVATFVDGEQVYHL